MPDEHPPAAPSAPRGAEALTLRQADQARTDFAAIESNLEFIMSQLSGVPTRKQLARYSLVVMVGTGLDKPGQGDLELYRARYKQPASLNRTAMAQGRA